MAFVLRQFISQTLQRHAAIASKYMHVQAAQFAANNKTQSDAATTNNLNVATDKKLIVSETCMKRLREICKDGSFLRVTVEGGGCSGFQYKFDLDSKMNPDDITFGEENAKVVIDNISLDYCAGATIDYHIELIRSGFRMLANPQAEQGCSCGASFAIKLD